MDKEREDMDEFLSALLREKEESESSKAINAVFNLLYEHYSGLILAGFPEERAFQIVLALLLRNPDNGKEPSGEGGAV